MAAAIGLCGVLAAAGAQVLPAAAVSAQGSGGISCKQLASALAVAPRLTFFPYVLTMVQQCGLPAGPASRPPACLHVMEAVGDMPMLDAFTGVQHVLRGCTTAPAGHATGQAVRTSTFADLTGYAWAEGAIDQLVQLGVIRGVGGGRFAPGAALTRAEFAALLQRTLKLQAPAAPERFPDVQPTDWFYAPVAAAAPYMQIPTGTAFDPNQPVTRIEAAATLGAVLIARATPADTAQQAAQVWAGFADGGAVPPALADDAATAVTAGLMLGEGTRFGVSAALGRAQAAVLFLRLLQQTNATSAQGGSSPASPGSPCTQGAAGCIAPAVWRGSPVPPTAVPVGDGHVSTTPVVGYVDSCRTSFGGGGARHAGPWLDSTTDTWNSTTKLSVQGSVSWPNAAHSFTIQGESRLIATNDLPAGDPTGIFPIQPTDPAYQYDTNPNRILPQSLSYALPLTPTAAPAPHCLGLGPIGVLINGVVLFDALDAAGRDAGAHEIQDRCDGHPQQAGIYHYHFISGCIMAQAQGPSTLVGYALDGYGIYVERDAQGNLPTDADLDACHGRTSAVMWDGRETVMYHYDATLEYPYTLGCYHGTPVNPHR